jgi:penicillin amidase
MSSRRLSPAFEFQVWADRILGAGLAGAAILRHRFAPAPEPRTLADRLAMLCAQDAPVEMPVRIHWNDHLVQYIDAGSEADLATALGIVHAHLRIGQMEVLRRVAAARVADMVGPIGIELDRSILLMDLCRAVPDIIGGLPPRTRLWCEAFLRGLNHQLMHAPVLPADCAALGIGREPWTMTDLFRLARLCCADATWLVWGRMLRARDRAGPAAWSEIWPDLCGADAPLVPGATEALLARALRAGSNSWAVAAHRSETGAAQIASDPHLSIALPNQWLVAGLHAPGFNAVGLMLPGLPFIGLGRNRHVAWGGTSLHAASSELIDLSALPDDAFSIRHETVGVRWRRPRRVALRLSPYGPVVSDGLLFRSRTRLALRWVGHDPSDEITAMLDAARADSGEAFRTALAGFAVPGQTMVYADTSGAVGRITAAHLPDRPHDPPADITSPPTASRWFDITHTAASLPALIGPDQGYVASANERPPPGRVPIGYFFAPPDRAARLHRALAPPASIGRDTMRALQADTLSYGALALRDAWCPLLPAAETPARAALVGWDGRYDTASAGALVFEAVLAEALRRLLSRARQKLVRTVWTGRATLAAELMAQPPQRLRRALAHGLRAADRLLRRHGTWGAVHRAAPAHLLGNLPLLRGRYSAPAFAVAGGNDTLEKSANPPVTGPHRVTFGSCARHRSNLADPDDNEFVLLGGQDGYIGSTCATDQIALWQRGETMSVPLRPETAARTFRNHTLVRPVS